MIQARRRAYRGDITLPEWLAEREQGSFWVPSQENPDKMLNLASDILLEVENDDLEARERLKTACAQAGVLYDGFSIGEALRKARGRVRA